MRRACAGSLAPPAKSSNASMVVYLGVYSARSRNRVVSSTRPADNSFTWPGEKPPIRSVRMVLLKPSRAILGTANGTRLQIWDCNGSAAQKFSVNGGGPVAGPGATCLDVDGDDVGGNGKAVQLWACQSYAVDQHWYHNGNGSLRTLGKCLDVRNAGTANGTVVQIYTCNGSVGQQWRLRANGALQNPNSGRCLAPAAAGTVNGTKLQIQDCAAVAAKLWSLT